MKIATLIIHYKIDHLTDVAIEQLGEMFDSDWELS